MLAIIIFAEVDLNLGFRSIRTGLEDWRWKVLEGLFAQAIEGSLGKSYAKERELKKIKEV